MRSGTLRQPCRWGAAGAVGMLVGILGTASAQTPGPPPAQILQESPALNPNERVFADNQVQQAGCSSCGGSGLIGLPANGPGDFGSCGCGVGCVPGRKACSPCEGKTVVGRFLCGLYECLCCPDPCYDPHWLAVADAAFFADAPRPITQTRLRWDSGFDRPRPDRAEYYFAREMTIPNQLEPGGPFARHGVGRGPASIVRSVSHEDLSLYTETAAARIGAFVDVPYSHVDPKTSPLSLAQPSGAESGFGDMTIGTKTLLLDCELLQVGFQFKTFLPVGVSLNGLGTGHVSLEPSFLFALRLGPDTDLQGQLAYWIPLGGDPLYEGNIFHAHFSVNHVCWRPLADVLVIGTAELNEWSILGGAYTVADYLGPAAVPLSASATGTIISAGPGVRLVVCDRIDIGVGSAFALTGDRFERALIRAEFRWRF